ncbi:MAG: type II toxin-antitoxin system RatA family toxin [Burkholderiales bacterium]|nr:type II toxin-antitoxin system RatA family toxin [Burkholderiales bacterium]
MQRVQRSVLVPYGARQMFDLVDDVERYREFLPWCGGSKVLGEGPQGKRARIDIDFHGVKASFTTDNLNAPPESIDMTLVEGPFRELRGKWTFHALREDACKVEFTLVYDFKTNVLEALVGPVFNEISHHFIDAFVRRAQARYRSTP